MAAQFIRLVTVAKRFGVHPRTLVRWAFNGKLPPMVELGPRTRGWWAADLEAFEARHGKPAGGQTST